MKKGWLESAGRGAYKRPGDSVDWLGGVYTLQNQLGLTIHPGGRTALSLLGSSHFVGTGSEGVFLYGRRGERLPTWFREYPWQQTITFKPITLFSDDLAGYMTPYNHKELKLKIAKRELAVLEMLYHVPASQGFQEAFSIMENLATLRHQVLQNLLEMCRSVKVKRLFLFMAEKANHPWFSKLNIDKVNLGAGKRVIVKNGMLDKTYAITIPRELSE